MSMDPRPPLKKHKNVGFLYNTGLDPQHHRPSSKTPFQWRISMAFGWRAEDGPFISVTKLSRLIALTKLSRSAHGACFLITEYSKSKNMSCDRVC